MLTSSKRMSDVREMLTRFLILSVVVPKAEFELLSLRSDLQDSVANLRVEDKVLPVLFAPFVQKASK